MSQTISVPKQTYAALIKTKRAHDAYLAAVQYMTGYMMETRRQLEDAEDMDGKTSLHAARMRGRIEAIMAFDRAVVDKSWDMGSEGK